MFIFPDGIYVEHDAKKQYWGQKSVVMKRYKNEDKPEASTFDWRPVYATHYSPL